VHARGTMRLDLLWDSGAVTSNRTLHVPYGGPSLRSDTRYRWRVQARTASATTAAAAATISYARSTAGPWSEWQGFATALLDPAEWERLGSEWINGGNATKPAAYPDTSDDRGGGSSAGPPPPPPPGVGVPPAQVHSSRGNKQLRTVFEVPAALHDEIAHASLFWAGVGYGKLWINGKAVGDEELGPYACCCFSGRRRPATSRMITCVYELLPLKPGCGGTAFLPGTPLRACCALTARVHVRAAGPPGRSASCTGART
jgi:hypothetical protein